MTAIAVMSLLLCLPLAKGKARQAAAPELRTSFANAKDAGPTVTRSGSGAALHSLRFLARHTNAVLQHKCLPTHTSLPRTWLQARSWHLQAHRAKKGTCVPPIPHKAQWLCIHSHEGSWTDTGDPHWGGLQMDRGFMATYGTDYIRRFHGFANRWPIWAQMAAAERAYRGVDWRGSTWPGPRYFTPWSTAGMCGL